MKDKRRKDRSIIAIFGLSSVVYFYFIQCILLGLIGGTIYSHYYYNHWTCWEPTLCEEEFYFIVAYPIYTIISGIHTKSPIYGAICGLLCGLFCSIGTILGGRYSIDGLAFGLFGYSIIGAFSGFISYRIAKKLERRLTPQKYSEMMKLEKLKYIYDQIKDYGISKSDELEGEKLDIYTRTLKQLDKVTSISNIEEVGKYAECPYCGSNIRENFYELGGIVRCDKCGAFHHKECFEYYGRKCGSSSCKLREA